MAKEYSGKRSQTARRRKEYGSAAEQGRERAVVVRLLKIGELADMTGVTVRTLHHYDKLGLLKPARVTEAGHRLYDVDSMTDLYRILALKRIGFSLKEIAELVAAENVDIASLLDMHLQRLEDEIARRQLLMSKLLQLKQMIADEDYPAGTDFAAIFPLLGGTAGDAKSSREDSTDPRGPARDYIFESSAGLAVRELLDRLDTRRRAAQAETDLKSR